MKLKTKSGWLTRYGLACGYIEQWENDGQRVTMDYKHGVLCVHAYDFSTHNHLFHLNFSTVKAARKYFTAAKKQSLTGGILQHVGN